MSEQTQVAAVVSAQLPAQQEIGGLSIYTNPQQFDNLYRIAEVMAQGKATTPAFLQGNPCDCVAIVMQAEVWKISPFALAQKAYDYNGKISYETTALLGIITRLTGVKFLIEYDGEWSKLLGKVEGRMSSKNKPYIIPTWTFEEEKALNLNVSISFNRNGQNIKDTLFLHHVTQRLTTHWRHDPKQQLTYTLFKRLFRRYFSDVLMGADVGDELDHNLAQGVEYAEVEKQQVSNSQPQAQQEETQQALPATPTISDKQKLINNLTNKIDSAKDSSALNAVGVVISKTKGLTKDDKAPIRELYKQKRQQFELGQLQKAA